MNLVTDLDRQLAAVDTHAGILLILEQVMAAEGFPHFSFVAQAPERYHRPPVFLYTTFPAEFLARYMQAGYMEVDPVVTYHRTDSRPWFWSVDDDWSSYGPAVLSFMTELKNWGFTRGVVLPYYTAHLFRGFVNAALDDNLDDLSDRLARVALSLPYFHYHIRRVYMAETPHSSIHVRLTSREREVFLLVADGLTSQEIAEQLNVAKATVEKYITAVQEKLGAGNRQQALCKAVSLGLILPTEHYQPTDETFHIFVPEHD